MRIIKPQKKEYRNMFIRLLIFLILSFISFTGYVNDDDNYKYVYLSVSILFIIMGFSIFIINWILLIINVMIIRKKEIIIPALYNKSPNVFKKIKIRKDHILDIKKNGKVIKIIAKEENFEFSTSIFYKRDIQYLLNLLKK